MTGRLRLYDVEIAFVDPELGRFFDYLRASGAFPVTVHQLRPGFNELELRFSAPGDHEARRLELAVNHLRLVPARRESGEIAPRIFQ